MSKRAVSMFLALLLLLTGVCAAGAEAINTETQWPVVTDGSRPEINLTVCVAGSDGPVEDMWFFKWLSEVSGVDIHVTGITKEAWETRKNLIMASGELADVYWAFNWSTTDLYNYGMEGDFIPLNDLIENYGTNIKTVDAYIGHDKMLGAATAPDGNIYGVPAMTEPAADMLNRTTWGMGINTEMLEKVGAEIPTTLEELYDALLLLQENGMNGTISAEYNDEFRSLTLAAYQIITAGTINDNIALKQVAQGEWEPVFIPMEEEYKQWLTMLNKLFEAGMLDETFFTTDTTARAAKNQEDPAAVIVGTFNSTIGEYPEIFKQYQIFLLNEKNELQPITYNTNHTAPGAFVITSACQYPEAALALIDRLYDPSTMIMLTGGPYMEDEVQYDEAAKELSIGYRVVYNDEGVFTSYEFPNLTEEVLNGLTNGEYYRQHVTPSQVYNNFYPISGLYARVLIYNALARDVGDKDTKAVAWFRTQQQENIPLIAYQFPDVYLTLEQYDRALELKGEIEDYVYSMEGRFISGDLSIEENYDEFINSLKTLGVEEYLTIYADAYALIEK